MPAAPFGHFCWPELFTSDIAAAKAFYGGLFGWSWREVPSAGGDYLLALLDGDQVGGVFLAPARLGPPRWNSYVQVASADATAEQAKALGATLTAGPFDVPDIGRMAWLTDPGGAAFALWQSGGSEGATRFGQDGTLIWTELSTVHGAACAAFYGQLFGWEARVRMDMPRPYTELFLQARGVGGIYPSTRPVGLWQPYFGVRDPGRVARAAAEAGGRILVPPTELPTVGSFAMLADSVGARFGVASFDALSGFTGG